jgi:hypothetical protein
MRIGALSLVIVWLVIGGLASAQRGYLGKSEVNCAEASTVAVTVAAGPLNYVGVNPKTPCVTPQPSQ